MTRGKAAKPGDEDNGLHVLNMAYGLGVEFGLIGPKDARPLLVGQSGAVRDQYYHGLKFGRALRFEREQTAED